MQIFPLYALSLSSIYALGRSRDRRLSSSSLCLKKCALLKYIYIYIYLSRNACMFVKTIKIHEMRALLTIWYVRIQYIYNIHLFFQSNNKLNSCKFVHYILKREYNACIYFLFLIIKKQKFSSHCNIWKIK